MRGSAERAPSPFPPPLTSNSALVKGQEEPERGGLLHAAAVTGRCLGGRGGGGDHAEGGRGRLERHQEAQRRHLAVMRELQLVLPRRLACSEVSAEGESQASQE